MKNSKILMLVGVLLLGGLFMLPLWNISLEAPQYPQAIGMNIHINKIVDMNPNDIKNINIMNHYVGMKDIPETLPEFAIFPYVVLGMMLLGLMIAFKMNYKWYLVWFVLMCLVGTAGMYDFYLWEFDYGHTLKANAAIKFQNPDGSPLAYQPPLLGTKTILNFVANSYPRSGAYLLFTGMFLSLIAFFQGKKGS